MHYEEVENWMKQALALGDAAALQDEVPIGALLVSKGKVIGKGYNSRESTHRVVAHAEIMALEDYSEQTGEWRLPEDSILVSTTEPCLMCTGALLWARVGKIFYGCSDPREAGLARLMPWIESGVYDHRFEKVEGGILKEECAQKLKTYFQKKRASKKDSSP